MAVNPLLFNAALAGFLAGMHGGQFLSDATSTDYASIVGQANAFATAIDIAIGADATITTGGATIPPTTGAIQDLEVGKAGILQSISFAVAFQHYNGSPTPQNFSTAGTPGAALVAGVKALYTEAIAALAP